MQPCVDAARAGAPEPHAKKKSLIAVERLEPRIVELRARFAEKQPELVADDLVFLDEAGSHIAMTRTYGRAPRGERVVEAVPRNRGSVTTMLGALTVSGLLAMMTVEGGTDEEVFLTFLDRVLAPKLKPGHVVVMDNAGAHKTLAVRRRIEATGACVLFLPPYSPELNPIEECWSKLKELLRKFGPRSRDDLDFAIGDAMTRISESDARGWIRHAGYRCGVN